MGGPPTSLKQDKKREVRMVTLKALLQAKKNLTVITEEQDHDRNK